MKTTVDVLIALITYAGNGGVATILPQTAFFLLDLQRKLEKDARIGRVAVRKYGDTPLTFERNKIARDAIQEGFDLTLSLDNDNQPDIEVGKKPWAQPFWDSSFEFVFERMLRGLPTVICSPYCGPPEFENVYVFDFENQATGRRQPSFKLEPYSRNRAALTRGIVSIGAGPTGVILITRSSYELLTFDRRPAEQILADYKAGKMDAGECLRAINSQSFFEYEVEQDGWHCDKITTEDVFFTRNVAMAGQLKFGEPVVFCNFDSWSAHWKPIAVQPPIVIPMDAVCSTFQEAVLSGHKLGTELREVDFTKNDRTLQRKIDVLHQEIDHWLPDRGSAAELIDETPDYVKKARAAMLAESPDVIDAEDAAPQPDVRKNGDSAPPSTGVAIKARMICGRKCYSVGHVTPDDHLACLTMLAKHLGTLVKNRPLRMLEVGSWVGESAVALLGGAPDGSEIFCVDTWEGSPSDWTHQIVKLEPVFDYFLKNVGDLVGKSVKPLKGESVEVANSFDDNQQLDLIFIDADHEYASVMADLLSWRRHLAKGGVLCGHDYGCPQFTDVKRAVDDFCLSFNTHATLVENTSIWFCGFNALSQTAPETEVIPNVGGAAPSRSLGG